MSLTPLQFAQLYSGMIAGKLPRAKSLPEKAVALTAQDMLAVDRVHVLVSEQVRHVRYFAVPSKLMASLPNYECPLAAAFPGNQGYKGPGVYLHGLADLAAGVLTTETDFALLYAPRAEVVAWAEDQDLPVYDVSEDPGLPFKSVRGALQADVIALSDGVTKVAGAVAAVLASGYFVLMGASGYLSAKSLNTDGLGLVLAESAKPQPLSEQFAQLQKVATVAVKAGGWIETYINANGKEAYSVKMPAWVTRDYLDALGSDVSARPIAGEQMITVSKGKVPTAPGAKQ